MLLCGHYFQVFNSVVERVFIDVMHLLVGSEGTAKVLFHEPPTCPDFLPVPVQQSSSGMLTETESLLRF
jgi:hypothetical protein